MTVRAVVLVMVLAAVASCDAQPSGTATTTAAPTYNPDDETMPVAADYEERAEQLIDKHSYRAELDKIAKQLPSSQASVVPANSAKPDAGPPETKPDGGAKPKTAADAGP